MMKKNKKSFLTEEMQDESISRRKKMLLETILLEKFFSTLLEKEEPVPRKKKQKKKPKLSAKNLGKKSKEAEEKEKEKKEKQKKQKYFAGMGLIYKNPDKFLKVYQKANGLDVKSLKTLADEDGTDSFKKIAKEIEESTKDIKLKNNLDDWNKLHMKPVMEEYAKLSSNLNALTGGLFGKADAYVKRKESEIRTALEKKKEDGKNMVANALKALPQGKEKDELVKAANDAIESGSNNMLKSIQDRINQAYSALSSDKKQGKEKEQAPPPPKEEKNKPEESNK